MKQCKQSGCTAKLLTQSEVVTGFCFHHGDGEYHGDDYGTPRRTQAWKDYIGESDYADDNQQ